MVPDLSGTLDKHGISQILILYRTPSPAVNVKFAELPKSVQDHNDQLKGNRARINKAAYVRAREMHRRQTEQMQATDMDFV